jgi:hypothetical protein
MRAMAAEFFDDLNRLTDIEKTLDHPRGRCVLHRINGRLDGAFTLVTGGATRYLIVHPFEMIAYGLGDALPDRTPI